MGVGEVVLMALAVLAAAAVGVLLIVYLIVPVFKGLAFVIAQIFRFIVGMIGDTFRFVGALVLAVLYIPVVLLNVVIGRWSASGHYGRALMKEIQTAGLCVYRVAIGHPLRLFKAEGLVEGLEHRLPAVVAGAPTADVPSGGRAGQFDGYQIVGSLAPGGSGAKLYIANPDAGKKSLFARQGFGNIGTVVIKAFSTRDGSSLPQIVRESRSLDAAKRLGLILDHELSAERFYYVMRYVPGESLGMMTKHLHAGSAAGGLDDAALRSALGYVSDLVGTLSTYHRGGLWHKDVKPDNVIVDEAGRAHLVDFGLVSSLRSAMTLTTHGTEYFRDPEMVRLALKGVKVHEVDGTKFDIYGAGAVLFSVLEDGFPAHGVLSPVTKRCPEAVKWVIRRAMTDYDKRYPSAEAMLADLDTVRGASDLWAVMPADLPSMQGGFGPVRGDDEAAMRPPPMPAAVATPPEAAVGAGAAGAAVGAGAAVPPPVGVPGGRPGIRVVNWWSGKTEVGAAPPPGGFVGVRVGAVRSASEQVAAARARVEEARARVASARESRRARRSARVPGCSTGREGWNGGVLIAVLVAVGVASGGGLKMFGKPRLPNVPQVASEVSSHEGRGKGRKTAAAPAPLPKATGSALVVSDVLPPLSEVAGAFVNDVAAGLREAGLSLEGNVPGEGGVVREVPAGERDLIAEARLALGQVPIDDPGATGALRDFVEAGKSGVVVWIRPGAPGAAPEAVVFGGGEGEGAARVKAARAVIDRARAHAAEMARAKPAARGDDERP